MNKNKTLLVALDLIKNLKEQQRARGAQILELKQKQKELDAALSHCLSQDKTKTEVEVPSAPPKEKDKTEVSKAPLKAPMKTQEKESK